MPQGSLLGPKLFTDDVKLRLQHNLTRYEQNMLIIRKMLDVF